LAAAYERELLAALAVPARDLRAGDVIERLGERLTILEIGRPGSAWSESCPRENTIDLVFKTYTLACNLDSLVQRVPSPEVRLQIREKAIAFQNTLTKAGTIRKRAAA
jgi:hypothetical protein